jgi:hypothetical protein
MATKIGKSILVLLKWQKPENTPLLRFFAGSIDTSTPTGTLKIELLGYYTGTGSIGNTWYK